MQCDEGKKGGTVSQRVNLSVCQTGSAVVPHAVDGFKSVRESKLLKRLCKALDYNNFIFDAALKQDI